MSARQVVHRRLGFFFSIGGTPASDNFIYPMTHTGPRQLLLSDVTHRPRTDSLNDRGYWCLRLYIVNLGTWVSTSLTQFATSLMGKVVRLDLRNRYGRLSRGPVAIDIGQPSHRSPITTGVPDQDVFERIPVVSVIQMFP